jgi:hypothetical protein
MTPGIMMTLAHALPKKTEQSLGEFVNYRSLPCGSSSSPRNRGSAVGVIKHRLPVNESVIEFTVVEPKLFSQGS